MLRARSRQTSGFTIIEVLIVVVILGVLVSMGLPSMRDLIVATRLKGATSDVFSSLILARSEAIKRNEAVEVVPATAGVWNAGWNVRVVSAAAVLAAQDPVVGDVVVSGPNPFVRYRGDGRLVDASGALLASEVAFTFIAAPYPHIQMRCIKIDPSGRPSVRTDNDRDASNGCN